MIAIVVAFALLILGMGLFGVAAPLRMLGFVRFWETPGALWIGAGVRIVFGAVLFLVAPETRAPGAFQAFGILTVLAGVALPFVGRERIGRIVAWWSRQSAAFVRGWCVLVVAMGALLLYGVAP